jgi:hypothetical protein
LNFYLKKIISETKSTTNCTSTASPDRPKIKPPDRTLAQIDKSQHNLTIGHRSVILVTNRTAGVGDSSVTPAMQFYLILYDLWDLCDRSTKIKQVRNRFVVRTLVRNKEGLKSSLRTYWVRGDFKISPFFSSSKLQQTAKTPTPIPGDSSPKLEKKPSHNSYPLPAEKSLGIPAVAKPHPQP